MTQGHPRPGKTHDRPHLLTLLLFITMYRASRAGWLFIAIGTFLKPFGSVAQKVIAAGAGFAFIGGMVMRAIDLRHALKGCMFAFQSAGERSHARRLTVEKNRGFDRDQAYA